MEKDFIELIHLVVADLPLSWGGIRCYEAARIIAPSLRQFGKVEIKNGVVCYNTQDLLKENLASETIYELLGDRDELLKKEKISFFHSWCEVSVDIGEKIIVDYHPFFKVNDNIATTLMIVGKKLDLPHQYYSVAHQIGRVIVWLDRLPPYVVVLRKTLF